MSKNVQIGIDNIYVVHGITGYEQREESLSRLLKEKNQLDYRLITESEDAEQNTRWIERYFTQNITGILTKGPLFCTLVHILCYEQMVKNNDKFAVIFENDVCFLSDFPTQMKKVVDEASELEEGFIISLENSTLKFPPLRKTLRGGILYPATSGRCAGAYMIDQKAARKILEDLERNKCNLVVDWWHNDLIKRDVVKMYWAHPPLIEQGSSNGVFASSMSLNNNGLLQRLKWTAQKFYKMYILRLLRF